MCGRYTLTVDAAVLAELFDLDPLTDLAPRYNIAPTQTAPIVRSTRGEREWAEARWGLIPPWSKDASIGSRLINARAETAAEKPSFRVAFASRRCLVPADGFYEWVKTPGGKQPHHIRFADRRPFAFAGLWEAWNDPEGDTVESYTILTTTPNALVAPLHTRMPVVLEPGRYDDWLQPAPLSRALTDELLVPYPGDGLEAVPVSTAVNSATAVLGPECLEPVGVQGTLDF